MKPLPGRPPLHSTTPRLSLSWSSDSGGGFGSSSRDAGGVGVGRSGLASSTSPRRRAAGESTANLTSSLRGGNPTWMRKLEEKYQKLHHKIANIPTYNSTASRFNFFARKLNKERLTKLANNNNNNDTANDNTDINTSVIDNNNIDIHHVEEEVEKEIGRKSCGNSSANTAASYCKHSLETDDLTSQPGHRRLIGHHQHHPHYHDDSDDLNDENFPPTKEGFVTRPTTVLNGARLADSGGEGDLDWFSTDDPVTHPQARFCQLHRASYTNFSQLGGKGKGSGDDGGTGGLTLHCGGGAGSGALPPHCCGCCGCNVTDAVCAEKALSYTSSLSVGPPERDAATAELNAESMAAVVADLAVGPTALSGLAHNNNISRSSLGGQRRRDHGNCVGGVRGAGVGVSGYEPEGDVNAEARVISTCDDVLRHSVGQSAGGTGGVGGMVAGGDGRRVFVDVSGVGGGVGRRHVRRGVGGGGASTSGSDEMMGEASARGIRTLDPIASGGGTSKMRAAKTGGSQYSHGTTKSCPAALLSNELPVPSTHKVRPLAQQQQKQQVQDGQSGERQNMRVFAHMSMEARHAITETLKEMDAAAVDKQQQRVTEKDGGEGMEEGGGAGEEDEDDGDGDDGNNAADDSNVASASILAANLPPPFPDSVQQQQQQKQLPARRGKHRRHQRRPLSMHPNREDSSTSHKTSTRQTSWRTSRNADTDSSVNATVKGGATRSPRRSYNSNRKPPSTTQNSSTNPRLRPKSNKTLETNTHGESNDAEPDGVDFDLLSMVSVSVASNRSTPDVRHDPPKRMHLPAITSRTDPCDSLHPGMRNANIRHVNYRIQGVGSYRVAREKTFEITAPDFDIRYRDVITCQRGDRDTPPPEIFEKSVGKVKDWLNKYCAS